MNCENSILIRAPLETVYATTSNLENWPKLLPHYRWIRALGNGTFQMAARRGWLPIRWTARFEARDGELHFHHLKAFTRGMDVTWTFAPTNDGVRVCITHRLDRWYAGLLARYFIRPVAARTLAAFKRHLECGDRSPRSRDSKALAGQRTPK